MSEKLMIKGFNDGYLLQQHKPELANELEQGFANKQQDYAKGFTQGREQYTQEQSKDKASFKDNYFNKIKQQAQSKSQAQEQTKGKDQDLTL